MWYLVIVTYSVLQMGNAFCAVNHFGESRAKQMREIPTIGTYLKTVEFWKFNIAFAISLNFQEQLETLGTKCGQVEIITDAFLFLFTS